MSLPSSLEPSRHRKRGATCSLLLTLPPPTGNDKYRVAPVSSGGGRGGSAQFVAGSERPPPLIPAVSVPLLRYDSGVFFFFFAFSRHRRIVARVKLARCRNEFTINTTGQSAPVERERERELLCCVGNVPGERNVNCCSAFRFNERFLSHAKSMQLLDASPRIFTRTLIANMPYVTGRT